ncbi:MAG: hypothetical protein GSR78_02805 [Desulfurococcales archaeon]|nr:hypothetical protein [Desulfurococcales archaeon]
MTDSGFCPDAKRVLDESKVAATCLEPAEIGFDCNRVGGNSSIASGIVCGRRIGVITGSYYDAARSMLSKCGIDIVGFESRSPRTVHFAGRRAHVKLYVVSEEDIIEDMILEYLNESGIDFVPQVLCKRRINGLLVLLATSRVDGKPLASILVDEASMLLEGEDVDLYARLMRELGSALARIHDAMEGCKHDWCKPRRSTTRDVDKWLYRLAYRRRLVEGIYPIGDGDVGVYEVLDALKFLEESFRSDKDLMQGWEIIRGHGDLHLYQVYVHNSGSLVITDFEGEPYRDPARKDELEPPERDLAAVLRSLDYIVYMALQRSQGEKSGSLLEEWASRVARSFIEGYTSRGRSINEDSLAFWLAERASYELVYELTAATGLHPIPANALVSMRFKGPGAYLRSLLGG